MESWSVEIHISQLALQPAGRAVLLNDYKAPNDGSKLYFLLCPVFLLFFLKLKRKKNNYSQMLHKRFLLMLEFEFCHFDSFNLNSNIDQKWSNFFESQKLAKIIILPNNFWFCVKVYFKVEKILKDSMVSIPSPSVKIQINGGKVYLR